MSDIKQKVVTPRELFLDYEYIDLLGEGANGKTYTARERRTGNIVAIKELKLSDDPKTIDLFIREAEALKNINVRGVPKFYKSIIPDNPLMDNCYIIQEYVDYPSLQTILDEGYKFTQEETLDIMKSVAEILVALQTFYTPPIIHRDIKPSNILACKKDGQLDLYLIDFGAVANPQKKSGGSTIAGTFGYMAPEQMQGEACIQTDYYSLGATALHLFTGKSPAMMQADMFKLDLRPEVLAVEPKPTSAFVELLEHLLDPVVSNRPNSAMDLLTYVFAIEKGRKPDYHVNKKVDIKFIDTNRRFLISRGISKFLHLFSKKGKASSTKYGWVGIYGMAHRIDVVEGIFMCLEVVYEVDGRAYCGMIPLDKEEVDEMKKGVFPFKIYMFHAKEDPRICCLKRGDVYDRKADASATA